MKSREVAGTWMVRPDRSHGRSDHDKRRSVARIPAPPAARRGPNPRLVARSGPRTLPGRAGTPRLAAPDPLVPRLSGRRPARATASRRQAQLTVESVGANSYGVPVRSSSILAHRSRRFQPASANDAVDLEPTCLARVAAQPNTRSARSRTQPSMTSTWLAWL
jgi:hypothetical protein